MNIAANKRKRESPGSPDEAEEPSEAEAIQIYAALQPPPTKRRTTISTAERKHLSAAFRIDTEAPKHLSAAFSIGTGASKHLSAAFRIGTEAPKHLSAAFRIGTEAPKRLAAAFRIGTGASKLLAGAFHLLWNVQNFWRELSTFYGKSGTFVGGFPPFMESPVRVPAKDPATREAPCTFAAKIPRRGKCPALLQLRSRDAENALHFCS